MSILIAEDNAIQRQYLTQLYAARFPEYAPVESVADGAAAVEQARQLLPALIVLDIQMPAKNGVQDRLSALYTKLGVDQESEEAAVGIASAGVGQTFNPRNRTVLVALLRGLINPTELAREAEALTDWLAANRH